MKKLFFSMGIFALATLLFASCSNQQKNNSGFSVAINISGLESPTKFVLEKQVNKSWVRLNSLTLQNGKGTITGKIESPELYYLTIKKFNIHIPFWLENSEISLTTGLNSWRHPVIKGSGAQLEYDAFLDSVKSFQLKEKPVIAKISKAVADNNPKMVEEIRKEYYKIDNQRIQYTFAFAIRHNNSAISPYLVLNNCYLTSLKKLDSLTNCFNTTLPQNPYVKLLKERVAVLKNVAPGQHFTDFTLNDTIGKAVSLSSVVTSHKYTLVDFLASWCSDCRAENPEIVAAFKRFHNKGFTVFGVSLDRIPSNWLQVIQQQELYWTQVSDLKGWLSAPGTIYGVKWIPHNLLINQKGIIIAQDLAGNSLQNKLKELLK